MKNQHRCAQKWLCLQISWSLSRIIRSQEGDMTPSHLSFTCLTLYLYMYLSLVWIHLSSTRLCQNTEKEHNTNNVPVLLIWVLRVEFGKKKSFFCKDQILQTGFINKRLSSTVDISLLACVWEFRLLNEVYMKQGCLCYFFLKPFVDVS